MTADRSCAGMYSRAELSDGFRQLGVVPGDVVLMHASVRAVGAVAGGPDQIHLALKDVLTPAGTLMMYAGCPDYFDDVGRGHLTAEQELEILDKQPPFDALTTRAQRENGTLVEFFRTSPGSRVNLHVARFVVWGLQAEHLTSEHPWNYAFGFGSPLDRFVELDGKVLLLGSDHDNVTLLHYAEHIAEIPGKRVARFRVPVEQDGARVWRNMEEFDTSGAGVHANWPERFFARLVDAYLATKSNHGGLVGNARSYLFSARELVAFAIPWMKSIAADVRVANELPR